MSRAFAFVLAFLAAIPPVIAEADRVREEIDALTVDVRLDEVLVTPLRRTGSRFAAPFSVADVPAPDLSGTRAPRSVPEALRTIPGVMVQKTAYGQGSPFIRGLTGFRTLMLIDGIRLNNSIFRDGPNQYLATVDNLSLRSVEVVKGPGSVLYGSDSMGGTLNMLPLAPVAGGDGYGWSGQVYARVASAERSIIGRLSVQGGTESGMGFLLGVSRKRFGDLIAGDGELPETGYDEWSLDARLEFPVTDSLHITLGLQHVDQEDVPRTHKTVRARPWEGTTVGTELERVLDQRRDLAYLRAEFVEPFEFARAMSLTLSWHGVEEDRHRVRGDGRSDDQGVSVDTIGFLAQLVSETRIGTLAYGVDWYRDHVESYSRRYDADGNLTGVGIQGPVATDSTYDLLGVYVQDDMDLGSDLLLTAGVRGTYAAANAGRMEDPLTGDPASLRDSWTDVVGSVRLAWFGVEGMNVYGGVSQGFRAPNLSDLTRLDSARSNEIEIPSPGLDPERTTSFEIGAKGQVGPVRGDLALYHTLLRDFIQRFPTGATIDDEIVITKANIGDGFVQGVELALIWDIDGAWSVFGGGGYLNGEADTYPTSDQILSREYLDRLPPLAGYLGLKYVHGSGLLVAGQERAADDAERLSPRDEGDTQRIPPGGTPGYAVLDLWSTVPVADGLLLSLGVENLLDEAYRVHGSGQNEPGRNLWMSLQFRF